MIGGNIATNAVGINALKYGTMKDNLIGIEMIIFPEEEQEKE